MNTDFGQVKTVWLTGVREGSKTLPFSQREGGQGSTLLANENSGRTIAPSLLLHPRERLRR